MSDDVGRMYGWCVDSVWMLGGCLKGVSRLSGWCLDWIIGLFVESVCIFVCK